MINHHLPHATPESQGVDSAAILKLIHALDALPDLHSFVLLRHGKLISEGWWQPYAANMPHYLYSMTKSFTATAVGLAVAEGLFSIDDALIDFFPKQLPGKVSANLKAMRVRHLLTMSTGHKRDTLDGMVARKDGNWVKGFLAQPVDHAPGKPFCYNNGASYMLGVLVQQQTGMKLVDYLKPRLFEPLGFETPNWDRCPRGHNIGGWGLSLRTREIASFGQLYLQQGQWQGQQLLPATWVAQATARQVENGKLKRNDWNQGYGFQFWRCRHDAFRADGMFGQYCIIIPEQDAVLALTAAVMDMQQLLNQVWKHLLPGMKADPLPEPARAQTRLQKYLATLAITPVAGEAHSPLAETISGKPCQFDANPFSLQTIRIEQQAGQFSITLAMNGETHSFAAGHQHWLEGRLPIQAPPIFGQSRIMASAAWQAADTLCLHIRLIETPLCFIWTIKFDDSGLTLNPSMNVSFEETQGAPIRANFVA